MNDAQPETLVTARNYGVDKPEAAAFNICIQYCVTEAKPTFTFYIAPMLQNSLNIKRQIKLDWRG